MTTGTLGELLERANLELGRYKVIWVLLGGFLVAVGFNFKTPARHFQEIESSLMELHRTDTLLARRIDLGDSSRAEMTFYLRALMIAQCIDRPIKQTQLMGLPCGELLNPRPNLSRP